jgi:hypothetical protein
MTPDHDDEGDLRVHLESIPTLQDRIESFIYRRSFYDIFWYSGSEEGRRVESGPSRDEIPETFTVGALFNSKLFWRIRRAQIKKRGQDLYNRLHRKCGKTFQLKSMCVIARKNEPFVVSIIVVMAQVGGAIQLIQIASTAIRYTAQQVFGREFRAGQENASAQQQGARAPSANILAWLLATNVIIILILVLHFLEA